MYDGSRSGTPVADHSAVTLPTATVLPPGTPPSRVARPKSPQPLLDAYELDGEKRAYEDAEDEEQEKSGRPGLLFTLACVAVFLFFLNNPPSKRKLSTSLAPMLPVSLSSFVAGVDPTTPHPIIPLLMTAEEKWNEMVTSQSRTYDRAVRTYKSRYGRKPPPGFDKWFAFATQGRNHSLVDEYDSLMEDLEPFRALSPAELRRRTAELAQLPGISIVSIRNGVAQVHSKGGKWAPALAFELMIGAFVRNLPDMDIAINEKPEGRVLPMKQRHISLDDFGLTGEELAPNMSDPMIRPTLKDFKPEWLKENERDGSVWEAFRQSGSSSGLIVQGRTSGKTGKPTTKRRKTGHAIPPTRELTFNPDLDAGYDICSRPSLHALHSAFFSDQRSIPHLYPVFSPSKPNGFGDILIPSNQYWTPPSEVTYEWELKKGRTKQPTDVDWSLKKPTMFWRGKVTRGADTPPGHGSSFQKQRLVKMANDVNVDYQKILATLNGTSGEVMSASAAVATVNKLNLDVAMACDPSLGECAYLRSLGYRVEPPGPLSDAWRHKIVIDVDEIGFSPRFLALQESKSAVVKSSIQREFWRGWAVPWKHFIPVSSSYAELYNIQAFFEGIPSALKGNRTTLTQPFDLAELPRKANGRPYYGDAALEDIAMAGRQWKQAHVRRADMECYVYRLMIEWANLVAPPAEER